MKYRSTRGLENNLSFEDVLLAGYAKDKGLYVPQSIPQVTDEEFQEWKTLSYSQIVYQVMRKFISPHEVSDDALQDVAETCFKRFAHASVIGIKNIEDFSVFELFYGPTLAFKDLALFVVAGLLDYLTKKKGSHLIALVGTSGDTGSSALESCRGRDNIDIICLFPKEGCSWIQRLQMTTVRDQNTHVFGVEGTSDDLDIPIKQCFEDTDFARNHNLISLNSVNIGRIIAQIPIYIYCYYRLAPSPGHPVEIVVPTGAAGSITAGCIAESMGFPLRLVAAVNKNEAVARTLRSGQFCIRSKVEKTFANAMDIQVPYNVERLFYLFSNCNCQKVKMWMENVETFGETQIDQDTLSALKTVIHDSHVASDEEGTRVTEGIKRRFDYLLCPHTAIAASYAVSKRNVGIPRGVFATASPEKFPEAIAAAGFKAPEERLKEMLRNEMNFPELKEGENWLEILKEKIISITAAKGAKTNTHFIS